MEKDELTERIIGCAMRVSTALGPGFLEKIYENALAIELKKAGLAFRQQEPITVRYEGHIVGDYVADLVVEGRVIVELKATRSSDPIHEAQLINYLKATGVRVGLLLNFGSPRLGIKRLVF